MFILFFFFFQKQNKIKNNINNNNIKKIKKKNSYVHCFLNEKFKLKHNKQIQSPTLI
jgi:hypothetical protein